MKGDDKMKALQIEHRSMWCEPEMTIHLIDDFSDYKKELIAKRFDVKSIDEISVGSYVEDATRRITFVEIND